MVDKIPERRGIHDRPDSALASGRDVPSGGDGDRRSDLEDRVGPYAPTARRIAAIVAHELGKRSDDEQIRQCAGDAIRDLMARPDPVRGRDRWCQQATLRRYLDQIGG